MVIPILARHLCSFNTLIKANHQSSTSKILSYYLGSRDSPGGGAAVNKTLKCTATHSKYTNSTGMVWYGCWLESRGKWSTCNSHIQCVTYVYLASSTGFFSHIKTSDIQKFNIICERDREGTLITCMDMQWFAWHGLEITRMLLHTKHVQMSISIYTYHIALSPDPFLLSVCQRETMKAGRGLGMRLIYAHICQPAKKIHSWCQTCSV